MTRTKDTSANTNGEGSQLPSRARRRDPQLKELAISCMLNTEASAVLSVIRNPLDPTVTHQILPAPPPDLSEPPNSHAVNSLKYLRSLIFLPRHVAWRSAEPSIYLTPFLDIVQGDDIPAPATAAALSSILKILDHNVFDEQTPGARDAIHSIVFAVTNCRLERTDRSSEDSVLMRILQVLTGIMRSRASNLLTDHAICTIVNNCFQIVQQTTGRGDALQRGTRHTMNELIRTVFSKLPEIRLAEEDEEEGGWSGSDIEDENVNVVLGYGPRCMIDIFQFLCSLLNVGEVVDPGEGGYGGSISSDEDIQVFGLILINTAIELGGEGIGRHQKLLKIIQDDLFHHLIHYATRSSPLVLSMICSTVLNLYQFLRRSEQCT